MKLTTTISDSIEACKRHGSFKKKDGYDRTGQKFLDAASRLEGLRDLANEFDKREKHLTEMVTIHPKGSDTWAAAENRLRELSIYQSKIKYLL